MEFVGFAVALVAVAVAVMLFLRSRANEQAAASRHTALQAELDAQAAAAKASAEQASDQLRVLEDELAEAIARRDEKAVTAALWNLELERSHRQWLNVIVPAHSDRSVASVTAGEQLTFAISQEVERLREEVGVAIRFDGAFDLDLEPENALGALRLTEELLAITAKLSDEVMVSLEQIDGEDAQLSIVLECRGWDDDEGEAQDLTAELAETAARLDGSLLWESQDDEALRAELRLPAPLLVRDTSKTDEPSGV